MVKKEDILEKYENDFKEKSVKSKINGSREQREATKIRKIQCDKANKKIVDALFGARENVTVRSKEELLLIADQNRRNFRTRKNDHALKNHCKSCGRPL